MPLWLSVEQLLIQTWDIEALLKMCGLLLHMSDEGRSAMQGMTVMSRSRRGRCRSNATAANRTPWTMERSASWNESFACFSHRQNC